MRAYTVKAINVGSFDLGEADRVLTIFCAEKGLVKAVAKGARKPGSKMSGRSDLLCVNELLLAPGRTFEIITQAQSIESFPALRSDLSRLSYGLFYAELTASFGTGLQDDSAEYFQFMLDSLTLLTSLDSDPLTHCMEFEFGLLDFLGYKPELTFCIACRDALDEYKLSRFNLELGGIVCSRCFQKSRRLYVKESADPEQELDRRELSHGVQITPLVWKTLILRADPKFNSTSSHPGSTSITEQVNQAGQRIIQSYIEQRAGKRFKTLDLLSQLRTTVRSINT